MFEFAKNSNEIYIYFLFHAESSLVETDVIRVFDRNVMYPKLCVLLAKADQISPGFTKTEEIQIGCREISL